MLKIKRNKFNTTYNIKFNLINKKYNLEAFLDTGCDMFYKGKPVIVLNKKFETNIFSIDKIQINSGISEKIIDIFYIDKFYINKKIISVYCVFLDISFDAIIGSDLL